MTDPGTGPTTISITTSAPPDPATVTEYGDALPLLVAALNHVTLHPEAMDDPRDAERLLLNIETAVARLPQLFEQVSARVNGMYADGRLEMDGGGEFTQPALAALAVEARVSKARELAEEFRAVIASAAVVAGHMRLRDDGSEEGSADG